MPRFRIIIRPTGKPQTPWRATRAEAIEDGVEKKLIERDEHVERRFWWHPLAEMEEERE